jgi:hypothetical protein
MDLRDGLDAASIAKVEPREQAAVELMTPRTRSPRIGVVKGVLFEI